MYVLFCPSSLAIITASFRRPAISDSNILSPSHSTLIPSSHSFLSLPPSLLQFTFVIPVAFTFAPLLNSPYSLFYLLFYLFFTLFYPYLSSQHELQLSILVSLLFSTPLFFSPSSFFTKLPLFFPPHRLTPSLRSPSLYVVMDTESHV